MDNFNLPLNNFGKNHYEWFLVQYKTDLQKCIVKVFKANEIICNINFQKPFESNGIEYGGYVWIRDNEQIFLGYVVYKAVTEQEALNKNLLIQQFSMEWSYSTYNIFGKIGEYLISSNMWLLVMYATEMKNAKGKQSIFAIIPRKHVVLKRSHQSKTLVAFIREDHSTHKGIVMKMSNNILDLTSTLNQIICDGTKKVEISKVLIKMPNPPTSGALHNESVGTCLKHIDTCKFVINSLYYRLAVLLHQISGNSEPKLLLEEIRKIDTNSTEDHNYASSNTSSGVSSALPSPSPTVSTLSEERNHTPDKYSAKRKAINEEQEYHEFSIEDEHVPLQQDYPKQIGDYVILGPNGTEVDKRSYDSVIWSSAPAATRQLLGFVFSSDVLATHTLTGKPSPAFYGRERPAKMQLDPANVADIIHCVHSKFNCTEREIRAAITTKCSDTAKKYKRRHQKQAQSLNTFN